MWLNLLFKPKDPPRMVQVFKLELMDLLQPIRNLQIQMLPLSKIIDHQDHTIVEDSRGIINNNSHKLLQEMAQPHSNQMQLVRPNKPGLNL